MVNEQIIRQTLEEFYPGSVVEEDATEDQISLLHSIIDDIGVGRTMYLCGEIMELNPYITEINAGMGSIGFWHDNELLNDYDVVGIKELDNHLSHYSYFSFEGSFEMYRKDHDEIRDTFNEFILEFAIDEEEDAVKCAHSERILTYCKDDYGIPISKFQELFELWDSGIPPLDNLKDDTDFMDKLYTILPEYGHYLEEELVKFITKQHGHIFGYLD